MNVELKKKEIYAIRDVANFLEKIDRKLSCDLMSVAVNYIPNSPFITKNNQEKLMLLTLSKEKHKSIILAFEHLENHLSLLLPLLTVANKFFPNNQVIVRLTLKYQEALFSYLLIQDCKREIEKLRKDNDLLRVKINNLHKGLNYSNVWTVKEIDDWASKLSPVECIDKNAEMTIIAFGGMALRLSMPVKEFFKSLLKKNINLIFVKDFQQCWYQNGLMGLTNNIEETVLYLKNIIPNNTQKLVCLGTSAGGFAAIRIGVELNANRVIAFAPQTNLNKQKVNHFKSQDSRVNEISFNSQNLNLNYFLKKSKNECKIEIHFGRGHQEDFEAAQNIKEFSELYDYDTDSHNIAGYMKEQGYLDTLLDSI